VLLLGSLFWALYDEYWGMRPWKRFQATFVERYGDFLRGQYGQAQQAEKEIYETSEYQQLKAKVDEAGKQYEAAWAPLKKDLDEKVQPRIDAIQTVYTTAKAYFDSVTYRVETNHDEKSREAARKDLEEDKSTRKYEVHWPDGKKQELTYPELEREYLSLKDQKSQIMTKGAELARPRSAAQEELDIYVAEQRSLTSPAQVVGAATKYGIDLNPNDDQEPPAWSPDLRPYQITVMNGPNEIIVDRCESCHMGAREPFQLTAAQMTPKGQKPDEYARAFVGHSQELLKIHDPQKFGCSTCHQGNGRATSSVVKGHGRHKYWLWPLYYRENMQAGCQTCHARDMVLTTGAEVINEGKALFLERGCVGCHRYEGYDSESEELTQVRQQVRLLEQQKRDNLHQARLLMDRADKAETDEEARRLNQQAENLRVGTSGIDAQVAQLEMRSKALMRDVKKVGPNLKEIRAKLNRDWIPVWLQKPTDFRPTTKMPNFRLKEHQIKAISAYLWQVALPEAAEEQPQGNAERGDQLFETRGCMACHSMYEGEARQGGDFAANLSRLGEKANYDYIVRWIFNPRHRMRPYCPFEKKDIGPEDYAKKGLPFVFDNEHSTCPNDGHELQVNQMTVMPVLRLSEEDARDIATYLLSKKTKEPSSYPRADYMQDPQLKAEGAKWIRHYGCAGCHEIAGFEEEGRIGTELTQEGSKPIERLDFALLTHTAEQGLDPYTEKPIGKWYNHKGFIENKLRNPAIYDKGKIKSETDALRMPDPHLSPEQIRALTTFLLGSQETSLPPTYLYKPGDWRKDVQDGWWIVKKYNCMGCHQFYPGQKTTIEQMSRYQDPDWKEQLPPKLLTEGARVDPAWLTQFLSNPALSATDINKNGIRPYLQARMPTFHFSPNELRKLVRFFSAYAQQPMPYIPQRLAALTPKETDMARALFTSDAAPCLKCHATGDPVRDRTATAPNFLFVKERLKADWTERWIIDPQSISPGTSMPSGLFRKQNGRWVFSGPVPPSFEGYDGDHTDLLVRYMFQLTPEEQRRAAGMMRAGSPPARKPVVAARPKKQKTGSD
jgi:cytochrome c551/c552